MKRSEIEDLILGPAKGLERGESALSANVASGLLLDVDPEERGLVGVRYAALEKDWVTVLVLDAGGTICLQREKRSRKGNNFLQLDLRHLPTGKYRFRLLSTNVLLSADISL